MKKLIFSMSLAALLLQACQAPAPKPKAQDNTPEQGPVTSQTKPAVEPEAAIPRDESLTGELLYYLLAAEMALHRNQLGVAVQGYARAAEISNDPRIAERATRIAVYARDEQRALQAARKWVRLEPDNSEPHQVLAALLVRSGHGEEALKHFEAVLNLDTNHQEERKRYMLITSLLSKEKDKQTALEVMEKLVAKRRDNPDALYALSYLALLVGNLDKAEQAVEQTLKLRPHWTEAHLLRANILYRKGESERLIRLLREELDDRPDDLQLRMFLARKLIDDKKYNEARDEFAEVLEYHPNNPDALYAMGLLGLQINDVEQAEQSFKQLIAQKQKVDEARYYLGQAAEMQNRPELALDYYAMIKHGRHYVDARIRTASILAKQGDIEAAREYLQNTTADTLDVELRLYLAEGQILREAREYGEAYKLYSVALQQMPDNTQLLYARALTAEKLDRLDVTIKDLQTIIEQEPNNAEALNALGYSLVDATDRIDEGINYIKRAFQLKPDDPAIVDSMGWAYYRKGDYDKALSYLRKAFNMLKDGEIAAHLGEVLWVSGRKDDARKVWEDALRDTPKHQILLNVIQRFTE
jgi:tetratricopeptide (TPR) repeat protein